jgi:hypothetical protein
MPFFMRGALVEYGSDFLGPIPNIVVFQFNPEQISRTINIPSNNSRSDNPETSRLTEPRAMSAPPTESFSITAHFSAMDDLGEGGAVSAIPRVFGIGPQLAALEKMAQTSAGFLSQGIGAAIDAIGDALGGGGEKEPTRKIPREDSPRILFIWGPSRVLPVEINSLSITEQQYDPLLNPVQAQVQIGLSIVTFTKKPDDKIGQGALNYTNTVKEAQALLNLAKAVELAVDVIPF